MLQRLQQALFHGVEEVQAFDGLLRGDADPRLAQALQVTLASAGVFQAAQKRQISLVAPQQYFAQIDQAVNRLLDASGFACATPFSVFHLAVVLEKRNVVDRRLDTQHLAEFVVNLDAGGAHAVLEAASLDASGLARTNLLRQPRRNLLAQKAGHARRIGRQHRLVAQAVIQGRQDSRALEHQVSGVLDLTNAPVVGLAAGFVVPGAVTGAGLYALVQPQHFPMEFQAPRIVEFIKRV